MAKFYANITLMIDLFDAENVAQAGDIINNYITELAKTENESITWEDCDFAIFEETEDV